MKLKKLVAIVLALVMVFSFAVYSFAAMSQANLDSAAATWKTFPVCKKNVTRSANYAVQTTLCAYSASYAMQIGNAGGTDGAFGPTTESVVKSFQSVKGLANDGIVGQDTWNALARVHSLVHSTYAGGNYTMVAVTLGAGSTYTTSTYSQGVSWYANNTKNGNIKFFN